MPTIKTNREITKKYLDMKYELCSCCCPGCGPAAKQIDNACHRAAKAVVKDVLYKRIDIVDSFFANYKKIVNPVLKKHSDKGACDSEPLRHAEHAMIDILEDLGFETDDIY